ncbi:MAG: hypothetical protein HY721_01720 [Planctomycetes bacterium]|nr:hypothetical protein [Planctomycetota bacterium]
MRHAHHKTALLAHAAILPLLVLGTQSSRAAAPCFEPGCCFSGDLVVPGCVPQDGDCNGIPGRCFSATATWWDPAVQPGLAGEKGIHLRWALNLADRGGPDHPEPLGYPDGGFQILRRQPQSPTGNPWVPIARIYPATDVAAAIARIPASLRLSDPIAYDAYVADLDCDGAQDLEDLVELLRRAVCLGQGHEPLWWLEGSKNEDGSERYWDAIPPDPEFGPYDEYAAHRDTFIAEHKRPPLSYELKPLELLFTAAVDPVIARILGLYFVDAGAAERTAYDYMVVAHYVRLGRKLCAQVLGVSSEDARPVPAPAFLTATAEPLLGHEPSGRVRGPAVVELSWQNYLRDAVPLAHPDDPIPEGFEPAAGVSLPLRYVLYRREAGVPAFLPLTRAIFSPGCEGELSVRAPPVLIGSMPAAKGEEADPEVTVWKEPPYYRDAEVEAGKKYSYAVRAMDVFGRFSAFQISREVKVTDLVPPPAPIVTEATVFQTSDPAFLRRDAADPVRVAVLSEGAPAVLRVRWLWPEGYPVSEPDFARFEVVNGDDTETLEAVPRPAVPRRIEYPSTPPSGVEKDGACRDGEDNDGDGLTDFPDDPQCASAEDLNEDRPACSDGIDNDGDGRVDVNDDEVLEPHEDDGCRSPQDTNEDDARAESYEVYTGLAGIAEPRSELDPSDRVRYRELGVVALDAAGNRSPVSRRWKAAVRDVTAPDDPGAPFLAEGEEPLPPDAQGRSAVPLRWLAPPGEHVLYRVERASARRPEAWALVTPQPVGPFLDGAAAFLDRVPAPGRTDEEYRYRLRAMDPAGNASGYSPALSVLVRDKFPPARPVIARAVADPIVLVDGDPVRAEGKVGIEWLRGPEDDIARYRLYGTSDASRRASKRKMRLVAEVDVEDPGDFRIAQDPDRYQVVDALLEPGAIAYYRLEAVDRSGNVSSLSEWAAARPVDRDPPQAARWVLSPRWVCEGEGDGEPRLRATWETPADAVESRLLRRQAAGGAWGAWRPLTAWLGPGRHDHPGEGEGGATDPEREHQYKLEARDAAGNLGPSDGTVRTLRAAPDCAPRPRAFVRGDPNLDGDLDVSDAVFILRALFGRGAGAGAGAAVAGPVEAFPCLAAADANGSGAADISDAVFLLRALFLGGPAPPPPYPGCGSEPGGGLPCNVSSCED